MMQKKSNDGLPPNFDLLPLDQRIVVEEMIYRRQLKWLHGYCPGDPCLTSMRRDGVPLSGQFGKRVEQDKVEEVDVDAHNDE